MNKSVATTTKPIIIYFRYSDYRQDRTKKSNFDARVRPYWENQYKNMFKEW